MAPASSEDIKDLTTSLCGLLSEISTSLQALNGSARTTNDRLTTIEKLQKPALEDLATVLADENLQTTLKPVTVAKLQAQQSGRKTARIAFFASTELLESVLLDLPTRDLLLSQRVNKQCKSVIDGSQVLQQALFLLPVPQVQSEDAPNLAPKLNPLFDYGKFVPSRAGNRPVITDKNGSVFVPELAKTTMDDNQSVWLHLYLVTPGTQVYNQDVVSRVECHPTGPWRQMLLSQPPCPVGVTSHGGAFRQFGNTPRSGTHWIDQSGRRTGYEIARRSATPGGTIEGMFAIEGGLTYSFPAIMKRQYE
ncbi:hypothetical protein B0A50_08668 [Salinomyces thailandicus]|uniref:F-box domain-containing protein n=1 Tax=Salinomyces thailandicus TaxID=706561 RepID=A0A4U0TJ93_9PEZI|nr:hypothetical protein B0A50_08668 [Salinomyces thailandica]